MKIIARFFEPTPKRWRKVRNICVAVGTASMAAYLAPQGSLPAIPHLTTILGYGILMGAIGTGISQYQTDSKQDNLPQS
jgi:hypothetical protein